MKNTNKNLLNALAFIALVVVAFLLFARWISPIISLGAVMMHVFETLQNVLILIVIGISAFNFAKASGRNWIKILFWIAFGIFIASTVLLWI